MPGSVLLLAPTHKAVAAAVSAGWSQPTSTIAAALSKQRKRDGQGGYEWNYTKDPAQCRQRLNLAEPDKDVLFVDECSMLSQEELRANP